MVNPVDSTRGEVEEYRGIAPSVLCLLERVVTPSRKHTKRAGFTQTTGIRQLPRRGVQSPFSDPERQCATQSGQVKNQRATHAEWVSIAGDVQRTRQCSAMTLMQRPPLYAQGVLDNAEVKRQRCIPYRRTGRNRGMHTSTYLAVLHDIIRRLAANGIFVIPDMHGIVDRSNTRLWCDESSSGGTGCTKGNEGKLQDAWPSWPIPFARLHLT